MNSRNKKDSLLSDYRHLTPMEQCHKSAFLENMVNVQLQKLHPELFADLNNRHQEQTRLIEEEIKTLKKQG